MRFTAAHPGATTAPAQAGRTDDSMVLLGIALATVAGAWLSRAIAFSANEFSLFWPPAGIAYGALLAIGPRGLAAAAMGVLAWALFAYGPDPAILGCALAASVAGPLAAVAVQRRLLDASRSRGNEPTELRRLLSLYAASQAAGAPVAALIGTFGLRLSPSYDGGSMLSIFVGYWLVESLGVLLFAPAVQALLDAPRGQRALHLDMPIVGLAAALALLGVGLASIGEPGYARGLTHLFLPLAAFCAIRCAKPTAYWTLVACAALLLTTHALGDSGTGLPGERQVDLFSGALLVFSATALAQVLQAVSADRRTALAALARAAHEDPATGLANLRGLDELLQNRLAHRRQAGFGLVGVRLRNLDAAVDLLDESDAGRVIATLQRALAQTPGVEALARPEPDRFVAIWRGGEPDDLEAVAAGMLRQLEAIRIAAGSVTMQLAPALGAVWVSPRPGLNAELLRLTLREAELDAALRVERPLRVGIVDDGLLARHRARLSATERVREAILARRLLLLAQPIAPNRPECALQGHDLEVLVRLIDSDGALIAPADFLPAVAAAGLAIDLDRAVVARVSDWYADHPQALARTAKCAINLSATSLADPGFPEYAKAALPDRGLPADRFAFEITESSELLNPAQAAESLTQLRALGFRVALDDFGTGLSTFDYLKKLPVDYVKIDGSFVRDLEADPVDAEIVASIVRVARRRGLRTVAEYVSSEALRQRVTELGVDHSQGYAIGRPIPIAEVLGLTTETGSPGGSGGPDDSGGPGGQLG